MKFLRLIAGEPALVIGAVLAIIGVCTAFGLGITKGQSDAIVALVGAVLAFLGSVVTRSKVSPVQKRNALGRFVGNTGAKPDPFHESE